MFDDFVQTITQNADEEKAESRRIEAQRAQATAESRARLEQSLAERKKEYETFKQKQGEVEAVKPPVFQPPPTPPNTQEMVKPSSLEKTMGIASIFALLSVGIAKGQAIYGLKAFSGFMQGAHAGNLEQAKSSIDDFKNSMDQVREANAQAEREYLNIFNNKKLSLEQQQQAVHLKALEFKDESFLEAMKTGEIDKKFEFLKDRRKVDKETADLTLKYDSAMERIRHDKAMEGKAEKPTTEEYKILLAYRANGATTGNPMVDKLTPEQAKRMSGLEPKPTAASSKARDQLIGTNNVLKEIQAIIPEMDKKGFLAKSPSKIAYEKAAFNRWRNAADPTLAKWKSLQGSIVGFERAVFNDIGARVKAAYLGALDLFDKPYTAEGLKDAIKGYQRILMDSPEAKRALSDNPETFSGGGPKGGSKLTYEEAQAIFEEAGRDKAKARELARQRGKEF